MAFGGRGGPEISLRDFDDDRLAAPVPRDAAATFARVIMARRRYTKKQISEALAKSDGIIDASAAHLGCHRTTILRYIDRYPELQKVRDDAWEGLVDVARMQLSKKVRAGETRSVHWLLGRSGDPKFVERHRIEGRDGGPIEMEHSVKVEFYLPQNNRDA